MTARRLRPSSPVRLAPLAAVLAAAVGLLAPPPAAGQDLEELLEGVQRLRELRERLRDRGDDRPQNRPPQRPVDPNAPGAPPGLYGPGSPYGPASPYGPGSQYGSGSQYGRGPQNGPGSPYGPGYPYRPGENYGPTGPGTDPFAQNRRPSAPAAAAGSQYVMRNPGVRAGVYDVNRAPGGAVSVRVVDENEFGRGDRGDAGRRDAGARAARAAAAGRAAADRLIDVLRDPRYALRHADDGWGPGGTGAARRLADRGDDASVRVAALRDALRPGSVAFSGGDGLSGGAGRGGFGASTREPARLAGWTDAEFSRLRSAAPEAANAVRRIAAELAGVDPYLARRSAQLDRLTAAAGAAADLVGDARGRLRRPSDFPRPDEPAGGRAAGGEGRVGLFALAARLTERTAALAGAAADDPVLGLRGAVDGPAGPAGGAGGAYDALRAPGPGGFGGAPAADGAVAAAARVDAAAVGLAAALGAGADDRALSAADADFERAWSAWGRAAAGLPADTPPGRAAAAVEEVHDALHDAVPNAGVGGNNNGGNRGNGGDPRARVLEAARRAARSAAAFDRALPRLDLRALRENRAAFAAAAGQLSAAAGYYARVAETAPPGADAERRARRVLEDAYDKADDGLTDLLRGESRRDEAAALARDVLIDLQAWARAVREVR